MIFYPRGEDSSRFGPGALHGKWTKTGVNFCLSPVLVPPILKDTSITLDTRTITIIIGAVYPCDCDADNVYDVLSQLLFRIQFEKNTPIVFDDTCAEFRSGSRDLHLAIRMSGGES